MYEYMLPFTCDTYLFVGKIPTAVCFGDRHIAVRSWRKLFAVILCRCNQEHHERLMYLRNKLAGKIRVLLSDKPDGLRAPVKIDENLYAATGYGSATMMYILRDRILSPTGFDYSDIRITLR